MEDLIARVVGVERLCAEAVSKAEKDVEERLAAHALILAERRTSEFAAITAAASEKLARSIESAWRQVAEDLAAVRKSNELIGQDKSLHETIKQKIVTMLLAHGGRG